MYGLPKSFDASRFVGREVVQICFNENQIVLQFEPKAVVSVESALIHTLPSKQVQHVNVGLPVQHTNLLALLGHSIIRAKGEVDGTLTMAFDNNHLLQILDNSQQYESYRFQVDEDSEIVV